MEQFQCFLPGKMEFPSFKYVKNMHMKASKDPLGSWSPNKYYWPHIQASKKTINIVSLQILIFLTNACAKNNL